MQGHSIAQSRLGELLEMGLGVTKDDVKAAFWYQKASAQGFSEAQFLLARLYLEGRGVVQSNLESARLVRKAALRTGNQKLLAKMKMHLGDWAN